MRQTKVLWAFLSTTIVIIGLLVIVFVMTPRLRVNLNTQNDGSLQLDITTTFKANSIGEVFLYTQEGGRLWEIEFSPTPPTAVSVRLHEGEPTDDGQMIRGPSVGEEFVVVVDYQYDLTIPPAPCTERREFRFKIDDDGSVKYHGSNRYLGDR
jgi:hypothetical protein